MMGTLRALLRLPIASMSAGEPPMCTGSNNRVFGVMAAAILPASTWKDSKFVSAKIGSA